MNEAEGGLVEIVTTVSNEGQAEEMARALVAERLAACVSLDPVRSVYRWKGETCDEREVRVVVKTAAHIAPRVEERIRELHPYETPAIVRLPVLGANVEYLRWVRDSVLGRGTP